MFNSANLMAITPIADALNTADRVFKLKEGTPLHIAVTQAQPLSDTQLSGSLTDVLTQATALGDADSVDNHEDALEQIVNLINTGITTQMSYIRNTALPVIGKIYGLVKDELGQQTPQFWAIKEFAFAPVHKSPMIDQLIDNWRDVLPREIKLPDFMPEQSLEQLMEKLATGNGTFDVLLADMVATHSANWLVEVYNKHFRAGGKYVGSSMIDAVDDALVTHLLARAYDDNPPTGLQMSLSAYNEAITAVMQQAAIRMTSSYMAWESQRRLGNVVTKWPRTTFEPLPDDPFILVHADAYAEFLAAGGSPEIIIGSHVSERERSSQGLLQKAEVYRAAYRSYVRQAELSFSEKVGERLASILAKNLAMEIVTLPDSSRIPGLSVELTQQLATITIAEFPRAELVAKPYNSIREIICNVLFKHAQALPVLTAMDSVMTENPQYSPAEANYHVALKVVVNHLMSQATLVNAL